MALDKLGQWIQQTLQSGDNAPKTEHLHLKDIQAEAKKHKPAAKKGRSNHSKSASHPTRGAHKSSRPATHRQGSHKKPPQKNRLRIIPIGGLNEIGKNMMVLEYGDDIIIIDMGFEFPSEDLLGIDYVIPDISYLEKRAHKIRGAIITHGHLDHTGGIPYILPRIKFPPVYSTKLTNGLIQKRIEEFNLTKQTQLNVVDPNETLQLGKFKVEFFRVNHSIPDGVGVVITTPAGKIVHTGDFKFDLTPADGIPADLHKMAQVGSEGVLALFSDSTNATKPGHTISEKKISETLEKVIKDTQGRIVIASFASLIGRIQQIVNAAVKYNREIFVSGRSMVDNIKMAQNLGYIKAPRGLIHDLKRTKKKPGDNSIVLTTGSQGEAVSALSRMSLGEHPQISIQKGDTVIISATPIVGNERDMYVMINNLCRLGANVIHHHIMDVHVSGHGRQEDLKLMLALMKPQYFIPVHGEYYMRQAHGRIAEEMGVKRDNVIVIENGNVLECYGGKVHRTNEKAETNYILVDGLGTGDAGSQVIAERQTMAQNGAAMVIFKMNAKTKKLVGQPEIITRGFIYMTESQAVIAEMKTKALEAYKKITEKDSSAKRHDIKRFVAARLDKFVHRKLARRPLIVPIIIEV